MGRQQSGLKDWAEWLLFFSSYLPLYIIIAVKTRTVSYDFLILRTPIYQVESYIISSISILFLIFGASTVTFLFVVVRFKRAENGQPTPVRKPEERNGLIITYILVHVVPFAFIDYASLLNFLAFSFLFLSIGVIQVRSRFLYVNPILSLWNYDMYKIEDVDKGGQMLLAKTNEYPESEEAVITAVELSNNVYITTR